MPKFSVMRFATSTEISTSRAEGSSPFLKIAIVGSDISSATQGSSVASVAGKNRAPTKQWARASEAPSQSMAAAAIPCSATPQTLALRPSGGEEADMERMASPHVFHAGHVLVRLHVRLGGCRADALHRELHLNLAGFFELQRAVDLLALLERLLEIDEHQMQAVGLELECLARLDLATAGDGAHLHHALIHGHLMDFDLSGVGKRAAEEAVGGRSGVLDAHIAGAGLGALGRGAGPGMVDLERSQLVLLGQCPGREQTRCQGKNDGSFH